VRDDVDGLIRCAGEGAPYDAGLKVRDDIDIEMHDHAHGLPLGCIRDHFLYGDAVVTA
jgi:hypothetical protein